MAKAIYDVSVPNIYEVEKALGDAKDKAPRAMKNAVNQTATRAKNMMIRQAKLRYAVSTAGPPPPKPTETPKPRNDTESDRRNFHQKSKKRSGGFQIESNYAQYGRKLGAFAGVPHRQSPEKIHNGTADGW